MHKITFSLRSNIKLLICLLFLYTQFCHAASWYVNDNITSGDIFCTAVGNNANSGALPSLPKLTLADAISVAANGDTIFIDKGTYTAQTHTLNKQLTIIGAGTGNTVFDGNNTALNFGSITVSNVIIKNLRLTRYFLDSSSIGQVLNISGSISGVLIENVLINGCPGGTNSLPNINISGGANVSVRNSFFKCSGYNGSSGGGIKVSASTLLLQNTVFYQNEDSQVGSIGGALWVNGNSNVTVNNCTFRSNIARNGGAIGQDGGTLTVSGSCFTDNISELDNASDGGGAIYVTGTSTTSISNCSFEYNRATNNGGNAVSADGGAIKFNSVTGTFSINTCSFLNNGKTLSGTNVVFDRGQDIYLDETNITGASITNCTFETPITGEVNLQNNDLEQADIATITFSSPIVLGGGTTLSTDGNSPTGLPITNCQSASSVVGCSVAVNCATENNAPIILNCVANKTLSCPAVMPNYTSEVAFYDDCTATVTQSIAPGTLLTAGVYTVTMSVTDQNNNTSACVFTVAVSGTSTSATNFGDFASAVNISTNGGTSTTFYNTTGSGANLIGSSTFASTNLGTYAENSSTLKLTGAELKTWKNGTGNVCGGTLYYVVYPTGSRPSIPSFSTFAIPFKANCSSGNFSDGQGPCNGNDQKWSTVAQNIDLTTRPSGNYTLEVFYLYTGSDSGGGCITNQYITNSCNNFTATFTIGTACTAPTISVQPLSTQSVCQNALPANISITASGDGLTYQWYSNTLNSSSSGTNLGSSNGAQTSTFTPPTSTSGTLYYYCVVIGTCGSETSSTSEVIVNLSTIAGTLSSDQTICNGSQPSDLTLVGNTGSILKWQRSLDAAFTSPTDIANTTTTLTGVSIGNLSNTTYFRAVVQSGVCSVSYSNSIALIVPYSTWNGSSWSNGVPTIETTVTFTGNYTSTSDLFACSLNVTNGANVTIDSGFDCTVHGSVTVDSGSRLQFNNNSNLLQLTNAINMGNIVIKRDTNPLMRLDYNIWSGPVSGQNLLLFSPNTLTNRFYTYNTNTNLYNSVNPSTNSFTPGVGFQIRIPNNHPLTPTIWTGTFTGVPNNGDYYVPLANIAPGKRFNMVGNPYPSPIDMNVFTSVNASNITGTLYFWRKTNSTVTNNRWSTWNSGTFVASPGPEPYVTDPNDIIRNAQGFLVEASELGNALTFNNSMRVSDNSNQFFKTATIERSRIWLNITTPTGAFCQQAVSYVENGTNEIDNKDGLSINNSDLLFTSIIPGSIDRYAIQSRPIPFDDNDNIPLSLNTSLSGDFTISIHYKDGVFTDNNQPIYIKDNYLNTFHNLNDSSYNFFSNNGIFDDRFQLVFKSPILSNNQNSIEQNTVIVYTNDNHQIIAKSSNELISTIKIFDLRGRLIFEKDDISASEFKINYNQDAEMVIVKVITDSNKLIIKKVIK